MVVVDDDVVDVEEIGVDEVSIELVGVLVIGKLSGECDEPVILLPLGMVWNAP